MFLWENVFLPMIIGVLAGLDLMLIIGNFLVKVSDKDDD